MTENDDDNGGRFARLASELTAGLARIEALERTIRRQDHELDQLRRELRAFGVEIPQINPAGRTPLSPQARSVQRQILAARARASKRVAVDAQGRAGMGTLRDPETKQRLELEAEDLSRRLRGGEPL